MRAKRWARCIGSRKFQTCKKLRLSKQIENCHSLDSLNPLDLGLFDRPCQFVSPSSQTELWQSHHWSRSTWKAARHPSADQSEASSPPCWRVQLLSRGLLERRKERDFSLVRCSSCVLSIKTTPLLFWRKNTTHYPASFVWNSLIREDGHIQSSPEPLGIPNRLKPTTASKFSPPLCRLITSVI